MLSNYVKYPLSISKVSYVSIVCRVLYACLKEEQTDYQAQALQVQPDK